MLWNSCLSKRCFCFLFWKFVVKNKSKWLRFVFHFEALVLLWWGALCFCIWNIGWNCNWFLPWCTEFCLHTLKEHEPWCKRYMELYQELRENWERLYWDEGYSKKLAQDHANYDSAGDDDQDFSPYRTVYFFSLYFWLLNPICLWSHSLYLPLCLMH